MSVVGHRFHASILREYDIRGVVGQTLSLTDALALGRTMGTVAAARGGRIAVVGYDGRHSSPALEEELCRGLASCGLFVLRIGLVPTPGTYFASKVLNADLGIMVTGSHNPSQYNGFKMVLGNKPYYGKDIQALADLAGRGVWLRGQGSVTTVAALDAYVHRLRKGYRSHRGLKVAWDSGNGAAGPAMVQLASLLPGDHYLINDAVDGSFPNHHPDPTVEANLEQLKETVLSERCDLGVAFDGDGDRIGVVDETGTVLWGDQILALLAREVLAEHRGAPIIADVKASQVLFDEIARLGGQPVMSPTGHSIIKSKMSELGAPLAGEMSGHIFFADRYYGYDDALYVAVRMIDFVARSGQKLSELRQSLPRVINTPETRIDVPDDKKFQIVKDIRTRLEAQNAKIEAMDGVRVMTPEGWWLLRASNTQPALVARCEASSAAGLEKLKGILRDQLAESGVTLGDF